MEQLLWMLQTCSGICIFQYPAPSPLVSACKRDPYGSWLHTCFVVSVMSLSFFQLQGPV